MDLTVHQQAALLALARRAITQRLNGVALSPTALPDLPNAGCFVTLHTRAGKLKGCIGTFDGAQPLAHNVARMAVAAATQDPRFAQVRSDELSDLRIEISALSPLAQTTADAVVVGTHGLCVTLGSSRGVLLPQVATDHGWDLETFLCQTSLKAGLPARAWRDPGALIESFTAQVFAEPR